MVRGPQDEGATMVEFRQGFWGLCQRAGTRRAGRAAARDPVAVEVRGMSIGNSW